MYFNTHTHLNSEELFDQRDHYIQNALEKGVNHMTVVGYDVASSQRALEIAHEYDFVYATVGISPNDCLNTTDEDLALIAKMAEDDKVVALGEIGLDYYYDDVPKEKQMDVFKKQIGSDQMALRFIKLGYYISLAGPVTFKNAKMPKRVATNVPLDSLLIETDDPYMAPVPLRGTTNEPANCIYIAKTIAELKGLDEEEVAKVTTDNAYKVFRLL